MEVRECEVSFDFLNQYFSNNQEVLASINSEKNPDNLIKSIWRFTNQAWICSGVQRRNNLPDDNGKECVEFFSRILQIFPESQKEQETLFALQEVTHEFLLKKLAKALFPRSVMISLLDAKKVCDSLNSTKRVTEEKPINLGKRSYGSYEFTYIPTPNEHKRKEREKEQEPNQQAAEKRQKVDQATSREEKTIALDLVRRNINKFAELKQDNWYSLRCPSVLEVLRIFGINTTLADYRREKIAIDSQIFCLIRNLMRTIHPDKVQPNTNDEKSFDENMRAFLSNVRNFLTHISFDEIVID